MSFIGELHPLLVHFPIALVLAAAAAELLAVAVPRQVWHSVAVANICAGAFIGVATAITGWLFALSPLVDATTSLEWHRWLEMAGAIGAALLSSRLQLSSHWAFVYRVTLFVTALLVTITAHLGGRLVWGAGFLRP